MFDDLLWYSMGSVQFSVEAWVVLCQCDGVTVAVTRPLTWKTGRDRGQSPARQRTSLTLATLAIR